MDGYYAWMIVATALVLMMTTPALALFYGGMTRSKSVLNMMMMSYAAMAVVGPYPDDGIVCRDGVHNPGAGDGSFGVPHTVPHREAGMPDPFPSGPQGRCGPCHCRGSWAWLSSLWCMGFPWVAGGWPAHYNPARCSQVTHSGVVKQD